MARIPQPWWREDCQAYFVIIRGERHNLGADKQEAFRRYYELMAAPPDTSAQADSLSAVALFDKFLAWCQKHRAPRTYEGHRWHLQRFVDHLGDTANGAAADLKPHHVIAWVDAHPDWGRAYRRNAITSVQRAYFWAEKVGHIHQSHLRHVEKPMPDRREQVMCLPTKKCSAVPTKKCSAPDRQPVTLRAAYGSDNGRQECSPPCKSGLKSVAGSWPVN